MNKWSVSQFDNCTFMVTRDEPQQEGFFIMLDGDSDYTSAITSIQGILDRGDSEADTVHAVCKELDYNGVRFAPYTYYKWL